MNWMEDVTKEYRPGPMENRETVLCSHWVLYFVMLLVPVLNAAMLLYWATRGKDNIYPASLVNFARAALIFAAMVSVAGAGLWLLYRWLAAQAGGM